MKQIIVENTTNYLVVRGKVKFLPKKTVSVKVNIPSIEYTEIKACTKLKIKSISSIPVIKGPISVAKVTEDSEVVESEIVTKQEIPEEPEEEKIEIPEEPEESIVKAESKLSCPYCDFEGTKMGVYHHVRLRHPSHYEEFKERVNNS